MKSLVLAGKFDNVNINLKELRFFEKLLNDIQTNGGLTVNSKLKKFTFNSGYIVAQRGVQISIIDKPKDEILKELKTALVILYGGRGLIGFWLNDNIIYVDIVHHFSTFDTAKFFGLQWCQKAIFDCSNNVEISFPFNS